jgi:hypothetical protein
VTHIPQHAAYVSTVDAEHSRTFNSTISATIKFDFAEASVLQRRRVRLRSIA